MTRGGMPYVVVADPGHREGKLGDGTMRVMNVVTRCGVRRTRRSNKADDEAGERGLYIQWGIKIRKGECR